MKRILIFSLITANLCIAKNYLEITPEIGINTGGNYNVSNTDLNFNYGGYARLYFIKNSFVIAPNFRWQEDLEKTNLKGGLILGGEIKEFAVIYGGVNYSHYTKEFEDGFSIEVGTNFFVSRFFSMGFWLDYSLHKTIATHANNHIFGGGISMGIPF